MGPSRFRDRDSSKARPGQAGRAEQRGARMLAATLQGAVARAKESSLPGAGAMGRWSQTKRPTCWVGNPSAEGPDDRLRGGGPWAARVWFGGRAGAGSRAVPSRFVPLGCGTERTSGGLLERACCEPRPNHRTAPPVAGRMDAAVVAGQDPCQRQRATLSLGRSVWWEVFWLRDERRSAQQRRLPSPGACVAIFVLSLWGWPAYVRRPHD